MAPRAAGDQRRARPGPARVRPGRLRRRGRHARLRARRGAGHAGRAGARAPAACSARSAWPSPTPGATTWRRSSADLATARAGDARARRFAELDGRRPPRRPWGGPAEAAPPRRPALPRPVVRADRRGGRPRRSCARALPRGARARYGYRMDGRAGGAGEPAPGGHPARWPGPSCAEDPARRQPSPATRRASFDGEWREAPVLPRDALGAGSTVRGPGDRRVRRGDLRRPARLDGHGRRRRDAACSDEERRDASERSTRVDPRHVLLASALSGIAEEMGAVLIRGAYSSNIKERRDCSAALFDAEGRMVAQAEHIPVHLGAMPEAVAAVMEREPGRRATSSSSTTRSPAAPTCPTSRSSPRCAPTSEICGYAVTPGAPLRRRRDAAGLDAGRLARHLVRRVWSSRRSGWCAPAITSTDVLELILANVRTPRAPARRPAGPDRAPTGWPSSGWPS